MDGTKYKTHRLPYVFVVDVSFYWVIFGRLFFLKFILSRLHRESLLPLASADKEQAIWRAEGESTLYMQDLLAGMPSTTSWVFVTPHKGSLL